MLARQAPRLREEAFERSLRGEVPETPPPEDAAPETAQASPAAGPGQAQAGLEESLTSRWLVWLGAITIALGSIFLVKYSIERGWLGPAVRVSLGFTFGVVLLLAGEWLRQRPLQRAIKRARQLALVPYVTD